MTAATCSIQPQRITGFHASRHEFTFPEYDRLIANRQNHVNGHLGLWIAHRCDWIKGFGDHLYTVSVRGRVLDCPIRQLARWSNEDDDFIARRQALISQGYDYLAIIEQDGRSDMGVVMNFDAIDFFQPITPSAPQRQLHDLGLGPQP